MNGKNKYVFMNKNCSKKSNVKIKAGKFIELMDQGIWKIERCLWGLGIFDMFP
jgi:hypothetical protein